MIEFTLVNKIIKSVNWLAVKIFTAIWQKLIDKKTKEIIKLFCDFVSTIPFTLLVLKIKKKSRQITLVQM